MPTMSASPQPQLPQEEPALAPGQPSSPASTTAISDIGSAVAMADDAAVIPNIDVPAANPNANADDNADDNANADGEPLVATPPATEPEEQPAYTIYDPDVYNSDDDDDLSQYSIHRSPNNLRGHWLPESVSSDFDFDFADAEDDDDHDGHDHDAAAVPAADGAPPHPPPVEKLRFTAEMRDLQARGKDPYEFVRERRKIEQDAPGANPAGASAPCTSHVWVPLASMPAPPGADYGHVGQGPLHGDPTDWGHAVRRPGMRPTEPTPMAPPDNFILLDRRRHAALVLDSPELLMMFAQSTGDSIPATRLWFMRMMCGYDDDTLSLAATAAAAAAAELPPPPLTPPIMEGSSSTGNRRRSSKSKRKRPSWGGTE